LFKTLAYGQITSAFSVREIESSLIAHSSRLYHCGMKPVKRTTLCDALGKRDSGIFEHAFNALVAKAKLLSGNSGIRFRNPMKLIDASTIELCLARFNWAKFRSAKGAVKLHVALDGDHFFPEQVRMTSGSVHEVNQMAELSQGSGTMHVYDRGYVDFKRLYDINLAGSFFVTRMKQNCQYDLVRPISYSAAAAVRFDSTIQLTSEKAKNDYPVPLRQVTYHDAEMDRDYVFITNDFTLSAQEIADTYKARWQVELFFKWVKQNLKVKTFWGTSRNAVFTQLWVALIVFMLLWISKHIDGLAESPQRILQLLKTSLLEKRSIIDLLREPEPPDLPDRTQLLLQGLALA
jgi:putative transposase